MSKMLDAFIQQTYGSYTKAQQADEQAEIRERLEAERQEKFHEMAVIEMLKDQSIKSAISIPSKIKDGELNQKTESHQNFKNYKHDLELDRAAILDLKILKHEDMESGENVGSVKEMFDNMFDDN